MADETDHQRRKRRQQRTLFDGIAGRYEAARQSYPAEIVNTLLVTGEVASGAAVLEIGCGTGQLTRHLAGRRLRLTVIDVGPAMVAAARRNVSDPTICFEVSAFEDFKDRGPFDLIVSASAFHWVDPDVGLAKAARLLRPGGWLALLSTGERYPEPLRSALQNLWLKYDRTIDWAEQPSWVSALQDTPLFGPVAETNNETNLRLAADAVLGVECTRAAFLSYSETDQAGFASDLAQLLEPSPFVEAGQETLLAMAQRQS
jgi:ubiquinone/menaquinone biosynthesis C-methylase UbiE